MGKNAFEKIGRGTGRSTKQIKGALAEIGNGIDVAFISATSQEAHYAMNLAASIAAPLKGSISTMHLRYSCGSLHFLSLNSNPNRLTGFRGKVFFDHAVHRDYATVSLHAKSRIVRWDHIAQGCNARHDKSRGYAAETSPSGASETDTPAGQHAPSKEGR